MANEARNYIPKDIRSAVYYAEKKLAKGIGGFFINTEFGRICVEANPSKKVSPINPCTVTRWGDPLQTKFVKAHADESADFYCGIDIYGEPMTDHLAIVEAFTRAMFMFIGLNATDDEIATAANIFIDNFDEDELQVDPERLTLEFYRKHLRRHRKAALKMLPMISEYYVTKVGRVMELTGDARRRIAEHLRFYPEDRDVFNDSYCQEIYGILLLIEDRIQNEMLANCVPGDDWVD